MSRWTIQIEPTSDGRFQWRHVPVGGDVDESSHASPDRYDTAEAAKLAGEEALQRHHEVAMDAGGVSDAQPEMQEAPLNARAFDPAFDNAGSSDSASHEKSPLSLSNLPIEAETLAKS